MPRATDGCGKTDDPRPVDKRKFDIGYLRVFGKKCRACKGAGTVSDVDDFGCEAELITVDCPSCGGLGFVPKNKSRRMKKDEIPD